MPGIIDSHFRPILNGLIGDSIDSAIINIGLSRSKSIIEILNLLETAIKNKNLVNGSQLWGMNQRLYCRHPTLEELDAIALNNPIHCNSAYASYEEDIKGSIEVGKLADIIVLDRDILSCSKERFNEVKVEMTMIDGDFEYIR